MSRGPNDLFGDNAVRCGVNWDASWRLQSKDGSPFNPTGWSARSEGRKWVLDPALLFAWSTDPQPGEGHIVYTTEDIDGKTYYRIHLQLAPDDSSAWTWARMYYDIEMTAPDGRKVRPVPGGWMEVSPDSTRS